MTLTGPIPQRNPGEPAALRLGVRAHDFGRMRADELAARIAANGFTRVQLALNKAIAGLNLAAGDLNAELAREIAGAFGRHGVRIEVLGCYINPIHPDRETRKNLLQYFKDHLRFARAFGCAIVALESGSVNADYSPHPANHGDAAFHELLAVLSGLVAKAEEFGVTVGCEPVHCHVVSTAQKMRRVLDTIRSKQLRVVFDAANLLPAEAAAQQSQLIPRALQLLGDDIVVVHAKDFTIQNGGLKTVPAGCGQLDFEPILRFVRTRKPGVGVLLEEAGEVDAGASAQFLQRRFQEVR